MRYTTPESPQKMKKAPSACAMAWRSRKAGAPPRWPKSRPAKTIRFFVHCAGRRDTRRLSATERFGTSISSRCRSVSDSFVMTGTVLCAMRELPRGGPCAGLLVTLDGFRLRVVSIEHGQQLRDRQEILDPLRQVEELELPPLPADGCVGAHDFAEARAVDIGDVLEVQEQLLLVLLEEGIDLVLEELVALAERHLALQIENRHSVDDPFLDLHNERASSPTFRRQKRPASVLRYSGKCQIFSGLGLCRCLSAPRQRRRPGDPLPQGLDHHIQNRDEDDVQEGGQQHAPRHGRADGMPRFLPGS